MLFRSAFNATKSSATFISMTHFVTQAYIHHTLYDGIEKKGQPMRDTSRMQRTFEGRLIQTIIPAPVTEVFISDTRLQHDEA